MKYLCLAYYNEREFDALSKAEVDAVMAEHGIAAARRGIRSRFDVSATLDEWLRHRLRALQLKQWRCGTTMYRELRTLGASREQAARIAGNARRWWRNSRYELNRIMPIGYFDRLGVPRLS